MHKTTETITIPIIISANIPVLPKQFDGFVIIDESHCPYTPLTRTKNIKKNLILLIVFTQIKMDRTLIAKQITGQFDDIPDLPLKPYLEELLLTSWSPVFEEARRQGILHILCHADHNRGRLRPTDLSRTFAAFHATPFDRVRVVILGQDPYPNVSRTTGREHAIGLSFAVPAGTLPLPPSLVNIFNSCGTPKDDKIRTQLADLHHWTEQGVFLLNASLTLLDNEDSAKPTTIWTPLINLVLTMIAAKLPDTIFMLWGSKAQEFKNTIKIANGNAIIFEAGHPSSRNTGPNQFADADHFEKANQYFLQVRLPLIEW